MSSVVSLRFDEWSTSSWATATVVAAVTVYVVLYRLSLMKVHPQEPPIIGSAAPFLGPLLGMLLHGGRHIKSIGLANRDKPIFTLPVPGSRLYIVTDPSLATAVQRASKALSFTPLVPDITRRVLGLDCETVCIVRQNLDPEPGGERGFLADIHDLVYSYLGPGERLNRFSVEAARELSLRLNQYADTLLQLPADGQSEVVDLMVWLRHFVTVGTAAFLYGARNPIAEHSELEDRFWDFVHGLGPLLVNLAPSVTARKGFRAREALAAGFEEYLKRGCHLQSDPDGGASELVRRRVEIAESYGFKISATARSELSFLFAGIINTATSTFWVVLQLFARPELLASVRAELEENAVVKEEEEEEGSAEGKKSGSGGKGGTLSLSVKAVRSLCPTLLAVFNECLRMGSDNYSTRLVLADHLLAGRHFLKRGSVVQVAGGVIHADDRVWGPDADEFDPRRWMPAAAATAGSCDDHQKQQQRQPAASAFRAFGGGKTLCPGRHFATAEILTFVAAIVLTFDLETPSGEDRIVVPVKDDRVLPVHILEPAARDAVNVRVKVRSYLAVDVVP